MAQEDTWYLQATGIASGSGVALFDLFNAAGSGMNIKILELWFGGAEVEAAANQTRALLSRTTTVGTGGSSIISTAAKALTSQAALPAQVTARTLPTGGAAVGNGIGVNQVGGRDTTGLNSGPDSGKRDVLVYRSGGEESPLTLVPGEGIRLSIVGTDGGGVISPTHFTLKFSIA